MKCLDSVNKVGKIVDGFLPMICWHYAKYNCFVTVRCLLKISIPYYLIKISMYRNASISTWFSLGVVILWSRFGIWHCYVPYSLFNISSLWVFMIYPLLINIAYNMVFLQWLFSYTKIGVKMLVMTNICLLRTKLGCIIMINSLERRMACGFVMHFHVIF